MGWVVSWLSLRGAVIFSRRWTFARHRPWWSTSIGFQHVRLQIVQRSLFSRKREQCLSRFYVSCRDRRPLSHSALEEGLASKECKQFQVLTSDHDHHLQSSIRRFDTIVLKQSSSEQRHAQGLARGEIGSNVLTSRLRIRKLHSCIIASLSRHECISTR